MISLLIAALLQTAPEAAAQADRGDGLPKEDYERVAWCHGALAGQLELEPIAHADMEKIEGKAKVAARAKDDAEMLKERRQYLKDYEHALAAAEAASPTMIHARGVAAEQQGYRLWSATRAKEPVWRILDWGMWDPNDVGCSEAAKRLLTKSQLFGAALKTDDKAEVAPSPPAPEPAKAEVARAAEAAPPVPSDAPPAPTVETLAAKAATPEPAKAAPVRKAKAAAKPANAAAKAKAKPATGSAEAIREAIANGKAEVDRPAANADAPAPAANPPPLRGPQQR